MTRMVIYGGTFDPLTYGHLDLIERGVELFDKLILAVVVKSQKETLFTLEERIEMAREIVKDMASVEVDAFDGLLIDYARSKGARVLIRGLRAYSDFEYEFEMALTNRKLAPEIETLFMMPKENHSYISSSTVKQVAQAGGETVDFVPEPVRRMFKMKYGDA